MPFTIFLLFKYAYKSNDSSTSISQQITLSGEDAKKASTTGLIVLQGPHQEDGQRDANDRVFEN